MRLQEIDYGFPRRLLGNASTAEDSRSSRRQLRNQRRIQRRKAWRRFCRELPRRSIQFVGFVVAGVGVGWLVAAHIEGLLIVAAGAYLMACPLAPHPLLEVAADLIRQRWIKPPTT